MSPAQVTSIVLRCDATAAIGVGHAVRCLALAQELRARGYPVRAHGNWEIAWVRELAASSGVELRPGTDVDLLPPPGAAVVLDGYQLDPALGARLQARGHRVLALVDGSFGAAQQADLYLDQNLGAIAPTDVRPGVLWLAGLDYVLLRDAVLAQRTTTPPASGGAAATPPPAGTEAPPVRVLTVFGGTDPAGAAPVLAELIFRTGRPLHLTSVTGSAPSAAQVGALTPAPGQRVEVVPALPDLAAAAVAHDLVVTASGSTVWELLYLGIPTAVVCVAPNQRTGYRATAATGATEPLGEIELLRHDPAAQQSAVHALTRLLREADRRAALAQAGQHLIDGQGRRRVADALVGTGMSGLGS